MGSKLADGEFEDWTRRAWQLQRETLLQILKRNAGAVHYLQAYGGQELLTNGDDAIVEKFKQRLPIIEYQDVEALMQRIADAHPLPLLCIDPIQNLAISSGTTSGKSKLIPQTTASHDMLVSLLKVSETRRRSSFSSSGEQVEQEFVLAFYYAGKQMQSKGGFDVGSVTTLHFRSKAFRDRSRDSLFGMPMSSPDEVILAQNPREQTYCHLLCGLYHASRVTMVTAFFAFSLVEALRLLEEAWREICHDIRSGTLSPRIIDPSLRDSVTKRVLKGPNPILADQLEATMAESAANNWKGAIPNLFPCIRSVESILSGAMLGYVASLRNYAGHVPLVCLDYAASEGLLGLNAEPRSIEEEISFILIPFYIYFEFIPMHQEQQQQGVEDDEASEVVDISGLKEGGKYELVLTTMAGLYRYRLGDIVEVKGFYNEAPKVSYVGRSKGGALSICTDKTEEREIQAVSEKACKLLLQPGMEIRVLDFSSCVDTSSKPGHYVFFWEIEYCTSSCKSELYSEIMQKCCNALDANLNQAYRRHRNSGAIGALELCVVREGSFGEIVKQFVRAMAPALGSSKPFVVLSEWETGLKRLCMSSAPTLFTPFARPKSQPFRRS